MSGKETPAAGQRCPASHTGRIERRQMAGAGIGFARSHRSGDPLVFRDHFVMLVPDLAREHEEAPP